MPPGHSRGWHQKIIVGLSFCDELHKPMNTRLDMEVIIIMRIFTESHYYMMHMVLLIIYIILFTHLQIPFPYKML